MLVADGTDGEQKAILNQDVSKIESVSVNIIPGASGNIYGGVYVGAKNPTNAQDSINSMVFLIKSDYTGWSDAPNRIDIVQGEFNGGWKHIKTIISKFMIEKKIKMLKNKNVSSPSSGVWMFKFRVPAGWGSPESSLPDLHIATFLLCRLSHFHFL